METPTALRTEHHQLATGRDYALAWYDDGTVRASFDEARGPLTEPERAAIVAHRTEARAA